MDSVALEVTLCLIPLLTQGQRHRHRTPGWHLSLLAFPWFPCVLVPASGHQNKGLKSCHPQDTAQGLSVRRQMPSPTSLFPDLPLVSITLTCTRSSFVLRWGSHLCVPCLAHRGHVLMERTDGHTAIVSPSPQRAWKSPA